MSFWEELSAGLAEVGQAGSGASRNAQRRRAQLQQILNPVMLSNSTFQGPPPVELLLGSNTGDTSSQQLGEALNKMFNPEEVDAEATIPVQVIPVDVNRTGSPYIPPMNTGVPPVEERVSAESSTGFLSRLIEGIKTFDRHLAEATRGELSADHPLLEYYNSPAGIAYLEGITEDPTGRVPIDEWHQSIRDHQRRKALEDVSLMMGAPGLGTASTIARQSPLMYSVPPRTLASGNFAHGVRRTAPEVARAAAQTVPQTLRATRDATGNLASQALRGARSATIPQAAGVAAAAAPVGLSMLPGGAEAQALPEEAPTDAPPTEEPTFMVGGEPMTESDILALVEEANAIAGPLTPEEAAEASYQQELVERLLAEDAAIERPEFNRFQTALYDLADLLGGRAAGTSVAMKTGLADPGMSDQARMAADIQADAARDERRNTMSTDQQRLQVLMEIAMGSGADPEMLEEINRLLGANLTEDTFQRMRDAQMSVYERLLDRASSGQYGPDLSEM